jgi:hypothetical protein
MFYLPQARNAMPVIGRLIRWSKLTFFLSLGAGAALLDACASKKTDERAAATSAAPKPRSAGGASASSAMSGGASNEASNPEETAMSSSGGTASNTSNLDKTAGAAPRKTSGPKKSGKKGDDKLWNVICE